MDGSVNPFEEWGPVDEVVLSSDDEEWNPPSHDSPSASSDSDSDGSVLQDAFFQAIDEPPEQDRPVMDAGHLIARRTRAQAPLTNVELADLEGTPN